jgi:hypothetical protein
MTLEEGFPECAIFGTRRRPLHVRGILGSSSLSVSLGEACSYLVQPLRGTKILIDSLDLLEEHCVGYIPYIP